MKSKQIRVLGFTKFGNSLDQKQQSHLRGILDQHRQWAEFSSSTVARVTQCVEEHGESVNRPVSFCNTAPWRLAGRVSYPSHPTCHGLVAMETGLLAGVTIWHGMQVACTYIVWTSSFDNGCDFFFHRHSRLTDTLAHIHHHHIHTYTHTHPQTFTSQTHNIHMYIYKPNNNEIELQQNRMLLENGHVM